MIDKFKAIFSGRYLHNVGWLGGAELFNRIFRLGTTVTLARVFSQEDYGQMAIIYTVFEMTNILTFKYGISAKLIQADRQNLDVLCNTSYWLNWILCIGVFVLQCLVVLVAYFFDNSILVLPLCASALVYLLFPLFLVHSAIVERENRLNVTAIARVSQSLVGNLATVILALMGCGVWSIVWPMIISTGIIVVVTRRYCSWKPPQKFTFTDWREIIDFGKNLLGVEILNRLRMNVDNILVGKFLGVEALGLYYFAFNAGSGITTNVVYAFNSALYPHLCDFRQDKVKLRKEYYKSLKSSAFILVSLVLLQSSLAPLYVPIIFGEKWVPAVPILIMICLSVIPRSFAWTSSILLNSINRTHISLYLDSIFTIIFTASILIAMHWGIYWVAAAVLLSHAIVLPGFTIWSIRYVFNRKS